MNSFKRTFTTWRFLTKDAKSTLKQMQFTSFLLRNVLFRNLLMISKKKILLGQTSNFLASHNTVQCTYSSHHVYLTFYLVKYLLQRCLCQEFSLSMRSISIFTSSMTAYSILERKIHYLCSR